MKNNHRPLSTLSYSSAFLIGVLLFWSFGRNWLDLESLPVFLAGLIGVVLIVIAFGMLNIWRNSHRREN